MPAIVIRSATQDELPAAAALACDAFMAAVAQYCTEEGVRTFLEFSEAAAIRRRMEEGGSTFVACEGAKMVGMAHVRSGSHLAMLFVDQSRQRRGVGRQLVATALAACPGPVVTVNASLNSEGAYARFGFVRTGDEQESRGLRFIPMEWRRGHFPNGQGGGR